MTNTSRRRLEAFQHRQKTPYPQIRKASTALWGAALIAAAGLLTQTAPPTQADGCGDGPNPTVSVDGCTPVASVADPPSAQTGAPAPAWLGAIKQRDPQFADSYTSMRERILKDGAIPGKYKFLMGMITDAIAAHPDGVRDLANNARAAGASEAEITEAVEVGYLYGGTAALVMGSNAFTSS
jgi:alkylhydroperoxidase/carboxymuconolactone decarboxylase family protein YurZ